MTLEQIVKLIELSNWKSVEITDDRDNRIYYDKYDNKKDDENYKPTELIKKLKNFFEIYPIRQAKIYFKTNPSDSRDNAFIYKYHSDRLESERETQLQAPKIQHLDFDKIKAELKAEMQKEAEVLKEKTALEELKTKLETETKRLENWADRAEMLIEMVVKNLVKKHEPFINGLIGMATAKLAGVATETENYEQKQNQEMTNLTEQEENQVQEAVEKILTVLSVQQFVEIAEFINQKPEIMKKIDIIKSLL